jgi:hypothetical protein
MICKNCKEYYQSSGKVGFGDYCPHCGSANFGLDRSSLISLVIAIAIFALIYFLNSGNL